MIHSKLTILTSSTSIITIAVPRQVEFDANILRYRLGEYLTRRTVNDDHCWPKKILMGPVYAQLLPAPERHWLWAITCVSEPRQLRDNNEDQLSFLRLLSDLFLFFAGADDEATLEKKGPFLDSILDMAIVCSREWDKVSSNAFTFKRREEG